MAYTVSTLAGAQPIATNSTVQKHALGTIVRGTDPTYGEGEFIYLVGVASTVVGAWVIYNATTWQTALGTTTNAENKGVPVAVAMSACVASEYGWYQISGNAVMKKTGVAVTPQVPIFISATAGRIKVLASSGQQILGAQTANLTTIVTTTSTVVVTIDRPQSERPDYLTLSVLFQTAAASLRHSDFVLDVGAGIRPQCLIKAKRHLCVEPHGEYVEWLRDNGYDVLQSTAKDALCKLSDLDTVIMLDVIEHMEKDDGLEVLNLCQEKARQVVVFTPIGFCVQAYSDGDKDAWGMNGAEWQTHRSGWKPSEFQGWRTYCDDTFHGERGGAFFAIWDRP